MGKKWFLLLPLVLIAAIIFTIDPLGKKTRAGLRVECQGCQAAVFLDDHYLDKTPLLDSNLQSGDHIIKIIPDDQSLAPFNIPIYLEAGTLGIIIYKPGPTPKDSSSTVFELHKLTDSQQSAVSFETFPENAFVSFDGQEIKFSPMRLDNVSPGDHSFIVSLPSYEVQEHSFQVLAGYESRITVDLAKIATDSAGEVLTPSSESAVIQEKYNQDVATSSGVADGSLILGPKVKILPTNYFVDQEEVLKVRDSSASTALEIGYARVGYYYPYAGETVSDTEQNWLKIKFQGGDAWLSSRYAEIID